MFASEKTCDGVSDCLQILGGRGYMKDSPVERYLRDTRIMAISEVGMGRASIYVLSHSFV